MSAKSPLGKIKDVADIAVVSVVSTVSGTVKDPVGTGQKVVGQALGVAGAVVSRVPGLKKPARRPEPVPQDEPEVAEVVPLQDKATKAQGDPVKPAAKKTAAKKTAAKKTAAKMTGGKKTAPKKTAAKKSTPKQAPPTDDPLIDPATAKAVRSETDVLRRGAERDPED